MPIRNFECKCGKQIEKIFLSQKDNPAFIKCPVCKRKAKLVQFSTRTSFKMEYGRKYGFASDSDRRAWMNNPNMMNWTGKGT